MFDTTDSLTINGINMKPYITEATFGYYDTWGEDSGYTLSNKFVGTFKGTIVKFTVKYAKGLTKEQLVYLTNNIFRKPIQDIVYKDIDGTLKWVKTHKGDLVVKYKGINKHDAFTHEYVGNWNIAD